MARATPPPLKSQGFAGAPLTVRSISLDDAGDPITSSQLTSISYWTFDITDGPPESSDNTAELDLGEVWFDTDPLPSDNWASGDGYNFKYQFPGSLFAVADGADSALYRIEVWATPADGPPLLIAIVEHEVWPTYSPVS